MTDMYEMFPTGKLKTVSLSEIESAISEALLKLVEENDTSVKLSVAVKSLEFDGYMRAKMSLVLSSMIPDRAQNGGDPPASQ